MSGGRDRVRMSDEEVAAFLRDNVKVQVASIGRDGAPHLTTLFYALEPDPESGQGGRLAFWTYARSQKIRNLERDPRITCLVEDGTDYFELRGASLSGRAELVRDPEQVRSIGAAVATRMVGAASFEELGELGRAEVERQVPKRVAVVVHADRVASWDHAKLLG